MDINRSSLLFSKLNIFFRDWGKTQLGSREKSFLIEVLDSIAFFSDEKSAEALQSLKDSIAKMPENSQSTKSVIKLVEDFFCHQSHHSDFAELSEYLHGIIETNHEGSLRDTEILFQTIFLFISKLQEENLKPVLSELKKIDTRELQQVLSTACKILEEVPLCNKGSEVIQLIQQNSKEQKENLPRLFSDLSRRGLPVEEAIEVIKGLLTIPDRTRDMIESRVKDLISVGLKAKDQVLLARYISILKEEDQEDAVKFVKELSRQSRLPSDSFTASMRIFLDIPKVQWPHYIDAFFILEKAGIKKEMSHILRALKVLPAEASTRNALLAVECLKRGACEVQLPGILRSLGGRQKEEQEGVLAAARKLAELFPKDNQQIFSESVIKELSLWSQQERQEIFGLIAKHREKLIDIYQGQLVRHLDQLYQMRMFFSIHDCDMLLTNLNVEEMNLQSQNIRKRIEQLLVRGLEDPEKREATKQLLLERINTIGNQTLAKKLSQLIVNLKSNLDLREDDQLMYRAAVILAADQVNPKSPYKIYARLKSFSERPFPNLTMDSHTMGEKEVQLAPENWRIFLKESKIFYRDLPPGIDMGFLIGLFEEFSSRFKSASLDQQRQINEAIRSLCDKDFFEFEETMGFFFQNQYLTSLFLRQGNAEEAAPKELAYLCKIFAHIGDLSNEIHEGEALSEREKFIVGLHETIQGCSSGRMSGIWRNYQDLPEQYHYAVSSSEIVDSDEKEACSLASQILHKTLQNMLENRVLFRELTGTPEDRPIVEFPHQQRYVKNALFPFFGLEDVSFDPNAGVLSNRLFEREPEEVIEIALNSIKLPELVRKTKETFDSWKDEEGKIKQTKVINYLTKMHPDLTPFDIVDLDEENWTDPYLKEEMALLLLSDIGVVREAA